MGNAFEFAVVAENEKVANTQIEIAINEVKRIEKLLTTFSDDSVTSEINRKAGIEEVIVESEVFDLITRCINISNLTQGAFDISYGSFDKRFWNFDTNMKELPSKENAKKAVALINYKNIILNKEKQSVFLARKGMRIGFGGIGKGYAADRAKRIMKAHGVENGFVNAAGDLNAWGVQENGRPWTIGIADPNQKHNLLSSLALTDAAIATSGNYEKYVIIDGKKYSHTIDPKTGYPISGIKSVSIITKNAELADALATPVTVMGIKAGLYLINQLNGVECIVIDDNDHIYTSNNIKK
ncbi:MAG: FAD:protein FMN transferase [Flavobacterium sp.]|nr:FAD:protein FMN transferase [Flavobacterium sp.]